MVVAIENPAGRAGSQAGSLPIRPGVTRFVPGERITADVAEYLKTGSAEGIYVEGCADQSLSSLRVVR
jgi:arginine/lysine/ornithine decarboxylase